jgi:hypothetical protein
MVTGSGVPPNTVESPYRAMDLNVKVPLELIESDTPPLLRHTLFHERAISVSGLLARVVRPSQRTGWLHNNQRGSLRGFGLHGPCLHGG